MGFKVNNPRQAKCSREKEPLPIENPVRGSMLKESQLFNIHVFENAIAANLYIEYYDKRNSIGT